MNRLFTSFGTRSWSASRDPALRQPMAIGLVCLFFILLFFVLALAGSRSVARALEAFMHTKGENVIETVVGAAEEKIRYLKAVSTFSPDWTFGLGDLEKSYDIQEAMVAALAELGHDIDSRLATARIAPVDLPKSAAQEHVAGIVVLDSLGAVEAATHPLPEAFQSTVGALRAGSGARDLVVDLAGAGQRSPVAGMIGLRRQSSDGAIILMLDTATLAYWQTKVALQSAIDEVGWRQGVRYFMVVDSSGVLFAGAGEDPSGYGSQSLPQGRASDVPQNADRPVRIETGAIIEVSAALRLEEAFSGTARVGIEMDVTDRIIAEHRKIIFLSMGLLLGLGLAAMWMLYISQRRNLYRVRAVQEQLHRVEHFAALGRMAAGVAHEIRNPLNAIALAAQRMQREQKPNGEQAPVEKDARFVDIIREEVQRLNRLVEDFLSFARNRPRVRPLPLNAFLDEIVQLMAQEANSRNIRLEHHRQAVDYDLAMDPDKIKQALVNLLKNAMESIGENGHITVSATLLEGHTIGIRVQDSGGGILSEDFRSIFDPGYTTKDKGLGLGLAIAHEIVRAHGGEIRVAGHPDGGAVFTVVLPLAERRLAEQEQHA